MASNTHQNVTTPAKLGESTSTEVSAETCSLRDVLERVGDKWTILVLAALERRAWGFRELQRAVEGISQRMLSVTLRRLERDGLVSRTVLSSRPPRVAYELTPLGSSLAQPMRALAGWAVAHRGEIERNRQVWDAAA